MAKSPLSANEESLKWAGIIMDVLKTNIHGGNLKFTGPFPEAPGDHYFTIEFDGERVMHVSICPR